jgi:hypothetical protein
MELLGLLAMGMDMYIIIKGKIYSECREAYCFLSPIRSV